MSIELRDYQKQMIAHTYAAIRDGVNRILMVAIMGAGKTLIASWIMRDAVSRGKRCVFLVSLNVLLDQTADELSRLGVDCTVLQADRPVDESAPVIVASLQTISARLRRGKKLDDLLGNVGLFFADESHITSFNAAYEAIEQHYRTRSIFLGLTATPWRLSKKEWLGQRFDALVEGPQPPEIIKRGGAVPCRGFTFTGAIDLDTLHVRNGDYVDSEIASQAIRGEALEHVFSEWERLAFDRPTLMIGATVQQAEVTRDYFIGRGIPAEAVIGCTPQDERKAIFERVKAGETKVITSVGCLTAGFNLPAISAILYVRATKSKALFYQSAGRASRPHPGKRDYLLLDFGKNLRRFGNPMGFQKYDISEPERVETPVWTKDCPDCGAELSIFAQVCPHCGYLFQGDSDEEGQREELILTSLNEYVDRFTREKIRLLRKWRKEAFTLDQSPDLPIDRFVAEYGHTPPSDWLHHACLTRRFSLNRKMVFLEYLDRHCNSRRWQQHWLSYHLRMEFGSDNFEQFGIDQTWQAILGVEGEATIEQVKMAYSEIAAQYDPAVYQGDDIEQRMALLNEALSDALSEISSGCDSADQVAG